MLNYSLHPQNKTVCVFISACACLQALGENNSSLDMSSVEYMVFSWLCGSYSLASFFLSQGSCNCILLNFCAGTQEEVARVAENLPFSSFPCPDKTEYSPNEAMQKIYSCELIKSTCLKNSSTSYILQACWYFQDYNWAFCFISILYPRYMLFLNYQGNSSLDLHLLHLF